MNRRDFVSSLAAGTALGPTGLAQDCDRHRRLRELKAQRAAIAALSAPPKVFAFDTFGTVFDFGDTPREQIGNYVRQVHRPEWRPLEGLEDWAALEAHPDAAPGIARLRKKFTVVPLSNCPLWLLIQLSEAAGVHWDATIPLELRQVYKPNPAAYAFLPDLLKVEPREIVMVTANKTFGDLENAAKLGWRSRLLVRKPEGRYDVEDLATEFGA